MEFKQRPLIRNATPPHQLFTDEELTSIKACVERKLALDRWGRKTNVKEEERIAVAELLDLARFHGYFPTGIKANGAIRWSVMCEPCLTKLRQYSEVITIRVCGGCSTNFHAHHYPDQPPFDLCPRCKKAETKKEKQEEAQVPF